MPDSSNSNATDSYCAVRSRCHERSIHGTGPRFYTLLLVQYEGPWEARAFEDSSLPQSFKDKVVDALSRLPQSKLLMVKRGYNTPEGVEVLVVSSRDRKAWRYGARTYDELTDMDLTQQSDGELLDASSRVFLVCTHGKKDKCCAKFGLPLYRRMAELAPAGTVWQSTHIGGDRFAANLIVLPDCIAYGRVDLDEADCILDAANREEVYLPKLRGRCSVDRPIQSAEYFLRDSKGLLAHNDLEPLSIDRDEAESSYQVRFRVLREQIVTVHLRRRPAGRAFALTCNARHIESPREFDLVRITSCDTPRSSHPTGRTDRTV